MKKVKGLNKQTNKKLIDTDNSMVITRGEGFGEGRRREKRDKW